MSRASSSSRRGGAGGNAASSSSSATALPLLQADAQGRFHMQPEAAAMLSSIKGKVCPVVVCGPYRSGKSTLLNLLLDRSVQSGASQPAPSSGFAVGGSVQACTKGMWIWGSPVERDGVTYVFIDSEGLGSVDQHVTFDTQIFSLSILLSSLFVLNTTGPINEHALEQLELVVQMTERIRVREEAKGEGGRKESLNTLAAFFPSFLWILRDFSLELRNAQGDPISENEYLEHALRPVPVGPQSRRGLEEKNRIRSAIATVFTHRQCVTMVRPVVDERELQRISSKPAGLRPEFKQQIERVKQLIIDMAQPKSLEGVMLNGKAFVALAQRYVDSINSNTIPTIRTAFASVQELAGREAMDAAWQLAQESAAQLDVATKSSPVSEEEMEQRLAKIQKECVAIIRDQAIGSANDVGQLEQQLITRHLNGLFQSLRESNSHRAERGMQSLLETLWEESGIESALSNYATYDQLNVDVKGFWNHYLKLSASKGPSSVQRETGRTFLDKQREKIFKSLFQRINAAEKQVHNLTQANEANQREVMRLTTELQQQKSDARMATQRMEMELTAAHKEAAARDREMQRLNKELHDALAAQRSLEAQFSAERREFERSSHASIQQLQSHIGQLESQVATLNSSLKQAQLEIDAAQRSKSSVEQQLRTELDKVATENVKLQSSHDHVQQQCLTFQQQLQQLSRDMEQQVSALHSQLNTATKRAEAAECDRQQYTEQLQKTQIQCDDQRAEISRLNSELATAIEHGRNAEEATTAAAAAASAATTAAIQAYSSPPTHPPPHDHNPLGLPSPTAGPLVNRSSLRPTKASTSASASSSSSAAKRKSSALEAVAQEENGYAHDDDNGAFGGGMDEEMEDGPGAAGAESDEDSDAEAEARAARMSIGAAATSLNRQPLRDPRTLTIAQLKSWLTSLDVPLPGKQQQKSKYVDMIYDALGEELEAKFPRAAGPSKKKGKK